MVGIDIVSDEEVEEEVAQTEEDREVENYLKSKREKHNLLQKGKVLKCISCLECRNGYLNVQYSTMY